MFKEDILLSVESKRICIFKYYVFKKKKKKFLERRMGCSYNFFTSRLLKIVFSRTVLFENVSERGSRRVFLGWFSALNVGLLELPAVCTVGHEIGVHHEVSNAFTKL